MEDIIDIIVTETTNLIEITSQPTDEIIDVNIIDNREDVTLNVTPTVVEININSLTGSFGVNWGDITGTLANQTDLNTALGLKADLVGGKVPSSQLPSYVDDVVEVANYAALPATGETGKIYITLDTNKIYRWSGSAYIEIADSTAVWGAITGTLSSQTDLQSALDAKQNQLNGTGFVKASGTTITYDNSTYLTTSSAASTYVPYTGATGNVDLGTHTIIAAKGTFSSSGSSDTVGITHSSGSGIALNIEKAGNGEGLYINKTSGSGNAATIVGTLNATTLVKSGGTSSQFLKADGSVDSTAYLPLAGGTLSGNLNAQTIDLSNSTASNALRITHTNTSYHAVSITATGGSALYATGSVSVIGTLLATGVISAQSGLSNGTGQSFALPTTSGTLALTSDLSSYLPLTGGTLTGALNGTSGTFTGNVSTSAQLRIEASGNAILVIGSRSSGTPFEIYNTSNILRIYNGSIDALQIATGSGAATFSGSVAVGGKLTVAGGGTNNILVSENNGAVTIPTNGLSIATGYGVGYLENRNGGNLADLYYSASKHLFTAGNVGIGTTSPADKLSVYLASAKSVYVRLGANNLPSIGFLNDNASAYVAGEINFSSLALTGGNVGIGTTSPSGQLHLKGASNLTNFGTQMLQVESSTDNYSGIVFSGTNGSNAAIRSEGASTMTFWTASGTSYTERMRITSGGNLLVGTTSDSGQKLVVYSGNTLESSAHLHLSNPNFSGFHWLDGTAYWIGQNSDYRQLRMYSGSNIYTGVYIAAGGSSWSSYSDERMKTDLMPIENATEKVSQLRSMTGRYKTDSQDKKRSFLLAQDVLEVLPEAVNLDTNSGMYGVQYTDVIPLLVASIKELKAELDTLKNK